MSHMSSRKLAAVLGASMLSLAAASVSAQTAPAAQDSAQQADTDANTPGDASKVIVVTGYARSLATALRAKRDSVAVIESLSAEDVGKLPDVSIADAISRLPGVAVQTQQGRGEMISIRGFSGDFTGALLNHREIATIDDNRRFDYSQLPGDMFNRVDVIKTSSANVLGMGLAGTVDLMSIDPLSNKRILSINLQGELNGYAKQNPDQTNKGYKATFIYSDKFADDTLGVTIGASAIESPVQNKQFASWGYPTSASGNYQLGGAKWFADTNVLYRQTGFGHIVYKPSDKLEVSLDAMYSNYKYREYQRGVEVPLAWGTGTVESNVSSSGGFEQNSTWSNIYAVQRNNYNTRDAHTLALGGNLRYQFNDRLRFTMDASYSQAKRHDNAYETYTGTGYNRSGQPDTVNVTRLANGSYSLSSSLNYTNTSLFKLTDPNGWGYYQGTGSVVQAGYVNEPDYGDTIKALRGTLSGDLDAGLLKGWELGLNYQDRVKTNHFTGYYLVPPTGTTSVAVPQSAIIGSVNPNGLSMSTLAYSVPGVLSALSGTFRNEQPSEATKQWYVNERALTGYAMLNFDGDVGGRRFTGNLGVQVINTKQRSTGFAAASTTQIVATDLGANYTYVLPSLNMRLEAATDTYLHVSISRTMSRARMLDENSSFTVAFVDPATGGTPYYINGKRVVLFGTGGNPDLRPYFSNNFDFSAEKYFAQGQGVIGLSAFWKQISNFVDPNNSYQYDLSAFNGTIDPTKVTGLNYTTQGYVLSPANTGRGWAEGVELQATVPLKIVTGFLDGFGVRGSAALSRSSIAYGNGTPVTLPGLSKWVINSQAYYEKNGFNARVSYQYRSDFLGEYLAFGAQPTLISTKARATVDAQIGYDFKAGPLNGLSIYVQGKNLTNSAFVTYQNNDKNQVLNYETYGPTWLAGFTMKF
ncbi:TonB-dependent receptor [Novosphingobium sp.]|uniref:TonB-dependent receptor n=1 Tax=Novosphingobium sp. TaxID=1874826 RepID=UPI0031D97A39